MPYFRVDDKLHSHEKGMRAGVHALGLWVLAASWCMDQLTDGWVPAHAARRLDPEHETHAADLVAAGLWHPDTVEGVEGWRFHEWDDWQHTSDYLRERRRRNAERMRTKRSNETAAEASAPQRRATPAEGAPETKAKAPRAPKAAPVGFAEFWERYPRKIGKGNAQRAYAAALKSADAATIAEGLSNAVQVWRATGTEDRFIPHASTWLNGGRWADEQPLPQMPATQARAEAQSRAMDLPPLPEPPEEVREAGGRAWTEWAKSYRAEQRRQIESGEL